MNLLMLGSGIIKRDGWMTLDCNPSRHADFVATIPPLPDAVKAVAWDEIEWIHGVTSLYPWDAKQVLKELHAVLAPGGKLILEQPDAHKCHPCEHPEWLFGDPDLRDPLHMARWTYSPMHLQVLLERIGFSRVDILPAQHHLPERDFRAEAYP